MFGSKDGITYCGPRKIEMIGDPSYFGGFLGFDEMTNIITVMTTDINTVGMHDLFMRVYLENYPDVETIQPFQVEIIYCQVLDLQQMPSDE